MRVKYFRQILLGIAGLLLTVMLAVVALVIFIKPENYKPQLEQVAHENGIELKIGGAMHWSLLPMLGFSAGDIALALPAEPGKAVQRLHVDELSLSLRLGSLLHKRVEISAFDLANVQFYNDEQKALHFEQVHLRVDNANNHGEPFPVHLHVDDTRVDGKVAVKTDGVLRLMVDLHGDSINTDRYAVSEKPDAQASSKTSQTDSGPAMVASEEQPLPLASLLQAQGEYRIRFDHMVVNHLQLANVNFDAVIEAERAVLKAFDADLYQGQIRNRAEIAMPPGQTPRIVLDMQIDKVQLAPMLKDLLQEKSTITAGVLALHAAVQGDGDTPDKILHTLSGNAQLDVADLVVRELNMEKLACEAAAEAQKRDAPQKNWPAHTILHRLHGESVIRNGIATVRPITARLDTLDLQGAGPVNLVAQTLDLKLDVTVLDKVDSANVCEAISPMVRDVAWPMRCEGSYVQSTDKLCRVDKSRMGSLIAHIAGKNIKAGGSSIKNVFKKLFD